MTTPNSRARFARVAVVSAVCGFAMGAVLAQAPSANAAPAKAAAKAAPKAAAAKSIFPRLNGHIDLSGVWINLFSESRTGNPNLYNEPDLSPAGKQIIEKFRSQYDMTGVQGMDANEHCVEPGMPTDMSGIGGQPLQIIQGDNITVILAEVGNQFRRIFMKGQKPPEESLTTRNGWSNGPWEGDTLVVETQLIQEWYWFRWPHADQAKTIERFSLKRTADVTPPVGRNGQRRDMSTVGPYVLVDDLTMIDPVLYDKPPQITLYFNKLGEDEFLEQACQEGLWWERMKKYRKPSP